MATQVLLDGPRNAVIKQLGAGTLDVSALLSGAPAQVSIQRIIYDVGAVADVALSWDATAAELITILSGRETMCFEDFGGLLNNAGAGKTGDIVVAGTGSFMVLLVLKKN
jgi:hypothetical protein